MLDDLQGSNGAHGNDLFGSFNGIHDNIAGEILRNALPYQQKSSNDGKRQQHTGDDSHQVHKKVSHIVLGFPSQTTDERDAGRVTGGSGNKHHEDDHQHLRQVRQTGFTGIVLQVGIGHKADDGIERKRLLHSPDSIGVEQRNTLNAENNISQKDHHSIGSHQCCRIAFPVHPAGGIYAANFEDNAVHTVKHRIGKGVFPGCNMIDISTHRNYHYQIKDNGQDDLQHTQFLLQVLKIFRVYQSIDQIATQEHNNYTKNNHGFTPPYSLRSTCFWHQPISK